MSDRWGIALGRRLAKWRDRLLDLRDVRTECIEAGIWLSAFLLFVLFACRIPWTAVEYLTASMPRPAWLVLTGALFGLSFFGYVDDHLWMRRLGGFLSFVFWLVTGLWLLRGGPHGAFPYAGCLHLSLAALWSVVWTRVGKHAERDRIAALGAEEVRREMERPPAWGLLAALFRH